MSRLWRSQLRIGLCPDRLVLAGYRGGLRRRVARRDIVPLEPVRDSAPWKPAVAALASALASSAAEKPDVAVVLSNHFARYALLPWNATLSTEAEWLALAGHRLASVHGTAAGGWAVRVSRTAPRGPRIACAVDQALLDALNAAMAGSGAALVSVQPYLMAAFNRMRSAIGNATCWLVVEEPGRLVLALIERGSWRAIRSRRVDDRWRTTLPGILERESAVLGIERPCTQAVVHAHAAPDTDANDRYRMRDLTLTAGAAPGDRMIAMALE